MKKFSRLISLLLLLSIAVTLLSACGEKETSTTTAPPPAPMGKNVIYMIGDGMGFHHIENTKLYMGVDKLSFEDYYVGEVTTYSASDEITDSAASATALATGKKTENEFVGMDIQGNDLKNIMEISKGNGRKTGIVTTDVVHGATPASFSAHTDRRTDKFGIMNDQIEGAVDLLLAKYDSSCMTVKNKYIKAGFQYTESFADLASFDQSGRIIGNLKNTASPFDPASANTETVSLKAMVEYALNYLTADTEYPFTLMIEGAQIDKRNHDNDIMGMIYALMEFDEAAAYVLNWASQRDDTVVIITADHESGGLKLAESKETLRNGLYTSDDHTAANVPLYLYGAVTDKDVLDNIEIFTIASNAVWCKDE